MDNGLSPIFLFGLLFCLPLVAIGGSIGFVMYRKQQRLARSEAVAQALGLEKVVQLKQMWWYEGKWKDGRSIGFVPIGQKRRSYSYQQSQTRTRYDSAVRIIIELLVDKPLGFEVARHAKWAGKRPLDSFETAFNAENGEKLTPIMQQALLDFVQLNPGTLWVADRATISDRIITSPEIMQGATAILLYEYKATNPEPDAIRQKTEALIALAQAFENA
ncbi:MAG: hypothetical protein AAF614_38550 [Chloroflexota bacterium]